MNYASLVVKAKINAKFAHEDIIAKMESVLNAIIQVFVVPVIMMGSALSANKDIVFSRVHAMHVIK